MKSARLYNKIAAKWAILLNSSKDYIGLRLYRAN